MTTISKPLYVYLQRPDNGEWVTLGRYLLDQGAHGGGKFHYAASYVEAGFSWSPDPVNLPFLPAVDHLAPRYGGLHDVLRDACPDSWGRQLIQREHGLPANSHESRFLVLAGNADRWGALAVGASKKPSIAHLASPRLPQLDVLARELLAIAARLPAIDVTLRKRLVATPSLGGARPKATVRDGAAFWLVKPSLASDTCNIPLLEHATQQWGRASGLDFAETVYHRLDGGLSALRVLRFDRDGERRSMALSAASLLQTSCPAPGGGEAGRWSYPRLAEDLRRIGAPLADRLELFGRMVFNAVVGNDDDHPRNHAVIYNATECRWRLAPAFDVVPNPDETPNFLVLQLATGRNDIARETMLADATRFGFATQAAGADALDALLARISAGFEQVQGLLDDALLEMMAKRLAANLVRLTDGG